VNRVRIIILAFLGWILFMASLFFIFGGGSIDRKSSVKESDIIFEVVNYTPTKEVWLVDLRKE